MPGLRDEHDVAKDFDLDRERQTFECLRCGHVEEPKQTKAKRAA
jgi:hypothetical protein